MEVQSQTLMMRTRDGQTEIYVRLKDGSECLIDGVLTADLDPIDAHSLLTATLRLHLGGLG